MSGPAQRWLRRSRLVVQRNFPSSRAARPGANSGMESPMDFVAGLSLTFEQANLDFARHFSRGFAKVGDAATAKLLDRIHRDEIAHVAHGLKWFRKWKNPEESDWAAFCRQLK